MLQVTELAKLLHQEQVTFYKKIGKFYEDYFPVWDDLLTQQQEGFIDIAEWILANKELIYGEPVRES